jgi:hypothetical protein
MKRLFSDKRAYFAAFGAAGGLASALLYEILGLNSPFLSWVLGTGLDGMCIGALLAFGQARYVGKTFDPRSFAKALTLGGIGGVAGGVAALKLGYPLAEAIGGTSDAGRFLGWTLGGVAVGFAVSKVVPNLKLKTACLAGAGGGFVGCGLMYLMSSLAAGTATTGAAIGLAIALAESAFREAWLEVTVRPKGLTLEKERTITVTLGDKPVLFGCAGDADVKLAEMAGAKAHFARISLVDGKIVLLDLTTEKSRNLDIGETFDVSNARITVRTKSDKGAAG